MKKGVFIVFEGGEKVGKTTQIKLLKEYLDKKGHSVVASKEPGGGDPAIREKLLAIGATLTREKELELFCEDRNLHIQNLIKPSLAEGKIVVLDRFDHSTIAYQGYGRGMPIPLLKEKITEVRNGLQPDLVILLDADPTDVLSREEATSRFDAEKMDFHKRVRQGFLAQAEEDPMHWRVVDASKPLEEVWQGVKKQVDKVV